MSIRHAIKWPYFHPFFGEQKIHDDGNWGVAESAVNLALWSALVGGAVYLAGAKKHAVTTGVIVFGAFVAAEVFFNAAGSHSNDYHLQLFPTGANGAPGTAAPIVNTPDYAQNGGYGYAETENAGYGEDN